ncbi:MAG: membrane protein YqaA with SNARE-associated domain [Candidatus Azotimanducaceae bacterium]|jgi:membrane protein YqaA with SNARE-associated domain
MKNSTLQGRSLKGRWELYHYYYKKSGFYKFLGSNLLKLGYIIAGFLAVFFVVEWLFIDIDQLFENLIGSLPLMGILGFFFASETILGLVPPDFFILWAKNSEDPYAMVGVLSILSYSGGILAYIIGYYLEKNKTIHNYIANKWSSQIGLLKKWGGFLIIISALLPLPFAVISLLVGMIRFPFKSFLLFGLFRFIRFFAYALVLFQL